MRSSRGMGAMKASKIPGAMPNKMPKGVVPKGIVSRAQRLGQTIPYDYFVTMVNPKILFYKLWRER